MTRAGVVRMHARDAQLLSDSFEHSRNCPFEEVRPAGRDATWESKGTGLGDQSRRFRDARPDRASGCRDLDDRSASTLPRAQRLGDHPQRAIAPEEPRAHSGVTNVP